MKTKRSKRKIRTQVVTVIVCLASPFVLLILDTFFMLRASIRPYDSEHLINFEIAKSLKKHTLN